jgi:hypothetical protein
VKFLFHFFRRFFGEKLVKIKSMEKVKSKFHSSLQQAAGSSRRQAAASSQQQQATVAVDYALFAAIYIYTCVHVE